eukprot:6033839-Alexandrium_andersonii.AAC.1
MAWAGSLTPWRMLLAAVPCLPLTAGVGGCCAFVAAVVAAVGRPVLAALGMGGMLTTWRMLLVAVTCLPFCTAGMGGCFAVAAAAWRP